MLRNASLLRGVSLNTIVIKVPSVLTVGTITMKIA